MIGNKLFKNYFNRYDDENILHTGFVQSMDLSAYTDITLLNDITDSIIDSYLYNEFKNRVMLSRWKKFLTWDETKKDFIIDADFYTEAVIALYVYLAKSEKFFDILKTNFSSLSASEMETINHGSKLTGRVYGEALKTNVYDKVTIELLKGTETENRGTHTDTKSLGQHTDTETHATYTDTENVGTHTDTENRGQQINTNQKIDSIHPFDANDFVGDTKSDETNTNGAQANSTVYGAQANSTIYGAQEQTNAYGAQSNSEIYGAQENTRSYGKTTNETKTRTDTETTGAHTDSETVSAYIDTKTRTKVILLTPDKYYEIQKELAEKNVYTLFAQAVNECFLNDNYSFQALEKWGCIV